MRHTRTSTIAISLSVALLGAACGDSDGATGGDPTSASSLNSTSTEPSATVGATTSTSAPTTEPAPTTAPAPTTSTTIPPTTAPAPAAPTTAASATTTAAPPVAPDYCDAAGPLPGTAVLDYSLTLDMTDDGTADDLIEAYDVDGWSRLRLTTGGSVVSEIINPAIDGRYRPLGVAPVLPGDSAELFAVIGEGSAAAEIGVFGIDVAGCLFSYTFAGTSDDFTMLIRPSSPVRSGAICFTGGIGLLGAEQQPDGKWTASSAAYEIATPWTLQYLGGSDDYSEGLDESELTAFEFDCFGLSL